MDGSTKQRYISTSIWSDGWFETLSPHEGYIYFNLLTNDHTNIVGIYQFSLKYICADTGISREEVNAAIEKFQAAGKVFFHKGYIIIPKWLKHQKIGSKQSGFFLGIRKILKALPQEIKEFISVREHYDFDVSGILGESSEPEEGEQTALPEEAEGLEEAEDREGVPPPKTGGLTPNGQEISAPGQAAPTPPNQLAEIATPQNRGSHPPKQGVPPPNLAHDLDLDLDLDLKKEKEKDSSSREDSFSFFSENPIPQETAKLKNVEKAPESPENNVGIENHDDRDSNSMAAPSRSNTGNFSGEVTRLFQSSRKFRNSQNLKPECRDLIIPPPEYDRTFQNHSLAEIATPQNRGSHPPKTGGPTPQNGGTHPPEQGDPPENAPPSKPKISDEQNAQPPPDKPAETKKDAIIIWNKARELWNKLGLKPVCRDLMPRAADMAEILRTFQSYCWNEIEDAIKNFAWHKFKAGPEYKPPPPYGSVAGFLKTGVEKYHDTDAIDQQFREER